MDIFSFQNWQCGSGDSRNFTAVQLTSGSQVTFATEHGGNFVSGQQPRRQTDLISIDALMLLALI